MMPPVTLRNPNEIELMFFPEGDAPNIIESK
jgi:hypothetical protein